MDISANLAENLDPESLCSRWPGARGVMAMERDWKPKNEHVLFLDRFARASRVPHPPRFQDAAPPSCFPSAVRCFLLEGKVSQCFLLQTLLSQCQEARRNLQKVHRCRCGDVGKGHTSNIASAQAETKTVSCTCSCWGRSYPWMLVPNIVMTILDQGRLHSLRWSKSES